MKSEESLVQMGKHWGWILTAGTLYLLLGIGAFLMPIESTIGLNFALAGLLVAGGIILLIQAIKLRKEKGTGVRFFQSVLALVVGGLMFRYPEGGLLGIALALSFYFFVGGAMQWILYSTLQPVSRVWGLISATASFFLGVLIVWNFPFSALWVPGLLLGIDLIFAGVSMITLAFSVRSEYREATTERGMARDLDNQSKTQAV